MAASAAPPRLVVVSSQFPEPNETFIVREIGELRRRGFAVTVFSLRRATNVVDPEARALMPLVVYPPASARGLVAEALRTLVTMPGAALRAIAVGLRDVLAALRTPVLAAKQALLVPLALAYGARLPREPYRLHAQFANVPTAVAR